MPCFTSRRFLPIEVNPTPAKIHEMLWSLLTGPLSVGMMYASQYHLEPKSEATYSNVSAGILGS